MNNTRLFLGLAVAGIYAACGACEDANFYRDGENILPVASPVEVVVFEEVPENGSSAQRLHEIFQECYQNNNAQAWQQLLAIIEKKIFLDKQIILGVFQQQQATIAAQQQTIAGHEQTIARDKETIDNFNELNRRRNNRINKRAKEAREKELSEKLNKEN